MKPVRFDFPELDEDLAGGWNVELDAIQKQDVPTQDILAEMQLERSERRKRLQGFQTIARFCQEIASSICCSTWFDLWELHLDLLDRCPIGLAQARTEAH